MDQSFSAVQTIENGKLSSLAWCNVMILHFSYKAGAEKANVADACGKASEQAGKCRPLNDW